MIETGVFYGNNSIRSKPQCAIDDFTGHLGQRIPFARSSVTKTRLDIKQSAVLTALNILPFAIQKGIRHPF